jgi:hypothetical protein
MPFFLQILIVFSYSGPIVSTVAANKTTSITGLKHTNTNEVDILKVITEIAKHNISKLIPLTIKGVSHTSLTVTEERIRSNVRSSHKRFILPTTLNFTVILRHCCFTISQNNTLNLLEFVLLLELRKNLMKRNQSFVQRSARKRQTTGNVDMGTLL